MTLADREVELPARHAIRLGILLGAFLLTQVPRAVVLWQPRGRPVTWYEIATFQFSDVLLLVGLGYSFPLILWAWRACRDRRPVYAVAGVVVLGLVAHPTPLAFHSVGRLVGVGLLATVLTQFDRHLTNRWIAVVMASGSVQALIGIAQTIKGGHVAVDFSTGLMTEFGGRTAAQGTLGHPYALACWLLVTASIALVVARQRLPDWFRWLTLAVVGGALACTFGRTVLIASAALVALAGLAAVRTRTADRRGEVIAVLVLVGALALGGAATYHGWTSRASAVTSGRQGLTTGRTERAKEAFRLWKTEPITGVGPGNYVVALHDSGLVTDWPRPSHNLVLDELAELGPLGPAVVVWVFSRLARRSRTLATWAVVAPLGCFFLFDPYPARAPAGMLISAVWMAAWWVARRNDAMSTSPPEEFSPPLSALVSNL